VGILCLVAHAPLHQSTRAYDRACRLTWVRASISALLRAALNGYNPAAFSVLNSYMTSSTSKMHAPASGRAPCWAPVQRLGLSVPCLPQSSSMPATRGRCTLKEATHKRRQPQRGAPESACQSCGPRVSMASSLSWTSVCSFQGKLCAVVPHGIIGLQAVLTHRAAACACRMHPGVRQPPPGHCH
jgi:hypothetical protein